MTPSTLSRPFPPLFVARRAPAVLLPVRVVAALRRWAERHRDAGEVAALNDRMLRDIGLARPDIEPGAPAWRLPLGMPR